MRTIKFRGKRIDNKEWVYGYLYELPLSSGDACMILTQDNNHLDNHLEPKYHLAFTLWVDLFVADPATIGQYTGLVDRNGREIYEGDFILYEGSTWGGVVQWHHNGYFFINDSYGKKYQRCDIYRSLGDMLDGRPLIVTGNIHDNPDIIEKGGEE